MSPLYFIFGVNTPPLNLSFCAQEGGTVDGEKLSRDFDAPRSQIIFIKSIWGSVADEN